MSRTKEGNDSDEIGIVLGMLNAVERDDHVTQRRLAGELGIALGLANAYLRRCAKKGFIKIKEAPVNRYAYYLTPRGFAEKSRLTVLYLSVSLDFFRRARRDCAMLFADCAARGVARVALWGAGDLAEIAIMSAIEANIEIVAVVDPDDERASIAGRPVTASFAGALDLAGPQTLDTIVLTDTKAPQASFEAALRALAAAGLGVENVRVLDFLNVVATRRVRSGSARRQA